MLRTNGTTLRIKPGNSRRLAALILGVSCAVAACAPGAATPAARSDASPAPARPTVLTIVVPTEPTGLSNKLFYTGEVDVLIEANMVYLDGTDTPRPLLAERLPSRSDGSWVVNSDGTMLTTYTLKADLKWSDGQPLTADDFVLAHSVYADDETPVSIRRPEVLMSRVVARDARTVEISWREPYVGAGQLNNRELPPMPRHVLGDLWAQDKTSLLNSPFWTSPEYVGSGPFRLTSWEKGVAMVFAANPYFALGAPLRIPFGSWPSPMQTRSWRGCSPGKSTSSPQRRLSTL